MRMNRRQFLRRSAAAGAVAALPWHGSRHCGAPETETAVGSESAGLCG